MTVTVIRAKFATAYAIVKPFFLGMVLAVVAGILASRGNPLVVYFAVGLFLAALIVVRPYIIAHAMVLTCLLITGLLVYFGGLGRAEWLPYILAACCWFSVMLYLAFENKPSDSRYRVPPFLLWLTTFYLFGLSASVVSGTDIEQSLVGIKTYVIFLGLALLLWVYPFSQVQFKKIVFAVIGIGVLQIFFTSYQYLFVRSDRLAGLGAAGEHIIGVSDSVVGSFGGNMLGGGLTSILALFLVIQIGWVFSLYVHKQLSKTTLFLVTLLLLVPLLLAEAKVIFVYVPAVLLVIFWHINKKRPIIFFGQLFAITMTLFAALLAYQQLHWSVASGNFSENLENAFSYSFNPDSDRAMERGALTRMGALVFWWEENRSDPIHLAVGYGLGASKSTSTVMQTTLIKRYDGLALDQTALSGILWDSGLIGAILFFGALISAYLSLNRLQTLVQGDAFDAAAVLALKASLVALSISLPYSHTTIQSSAGLFLLYFVFGAVSYLSQHRSYHKISQQNRPIVGI